MAEIEEWDYKTYFVWTEPGMAPTVKGGYRNRQQELAMMLDMGRELVEKLELCPVGVFTVYKDGAKLYGESLQSWRFINDPDEVEAECFT